MRRVALLLLVLLRDDDDAMGATTMTSWFDLFASNFQLRFVYGVDPIQQSTRRSIALTLEE